MKLFNFKKNGSNYIGTIFKQFIGFGIVGIFNTIISLGIYYSLIYIGIHYILANSIGFFISVLNAFYWNNKFVFKKTQEGTVKPLIKTFIVYGSTFILSTVLLYIMIEYVKISQIIAPIINLIITIPLNFVLNKFWAFK